MQTRSSVTAPRNSSRPSTKPAPGNRKSQGTKKQVAVKGSAAERLAIEGGPKAVTNQLQGWPQFDEHVIRAVEAVLRSGKVNYWTGKRGMEFEKRYAEWQGSKYAISVATGTAALHVGLSSLGIGPGDEVIVPSYTFIATSFSVVQAGAIPRFADVNREDHCISVESAEKLVNERTKAIMPVHLYGNVCDMDKIRAFAKKHNLYVIEDNAEAFGGVYQGKKTGTLSDIAGCSFCQNKTFTTGGEGGMVTTDDEDLAWKARSFRDHGYDVKQRLSLLELEQKLPYIHNLVGWNYRMTEMQSAIGLAELDRMETWNMPRRRRNARILVEALKTSPLVKYFPVDTPERQEDEMRHQAVCGGGERGGCAGVEGVLAAVPHGTGVSGAQCVRANGVSVQVEGICERGERELPKRGCAECAVA
ncbi:MAG: aminotransferase DegT [Verrucomicrobia bacterium]|nr:MAG: aminotransferase DegT [Verrucomicrobiota bacterium]